MRGLIAMVVAAAALLGAGAGGGARGGPCGGSPAPSRRQHVIWIWMENESYGSVIGSAAAPYATQLAHACGLAADYHGVSHPSLPNYLAATSGSTWGIADDAAPSAHPLAHPSIFSRLTAAGLTWRSYDESMPTACDLGSSGAYAVKHNPAAYYTGIRAACRRWDVGLSGLASALRDDRLPSFAFVTPNLCDDMHDCPVSTGDAWLHRWVPKILASAGYRSGSTVLMITFDEGTDPANHVATIVASASTRPGTTSTRRFDHYSLLRTTEQLLGLPASLGRARQAPSMRAAFHL